MSVADLLQSGTSEVMSKPRSISRRLLLVLCACSVFADEVKTVIGTGVAGADGQQIANPYGLTIGPDGALYFCEIDNHRISRLDLQRRTRTTVVDGQNQPYEVRFDRDGNLFFVDMPAHAVRRWDKMTHALTTVAGTGVPGFSGDNGPAVNAQFRQPHSIAFDRPGGLLVCDIGNHRIRRIDLKSGVINTYGGTGERAPIREGAAVNEAPLNGPRAIASDRDGNLYVVLREGNAVYRIDQESGRIFHFAGSGEKGYSGDGGPAKQAKFNGPKGIACAPDGSVYVADTENHVIRRIDGNGMTGTVLGNGQRGDGPDGDPRACKLSRPHGVFVASDGTVYVADSESHRIRHLVPGAR